MEALRQAKISYVKCHDCEKFLNKQVDNPQDDVKRFIAIAVKENVIQEMFSNPCILRILEVALTSKSSCGLDITSVIKAFESLELYMLLLVSQPWKPEYKRLKMYGGFYRTRIKSVLLEPEEIFYEAGYTQETDEIMVHNKSDKIKLLMLALDCRIAKCECESIQEEYNKVKYIGKSLHSVVCSKLGIHNAEEKQSQSVLSGNNLYSNEVNSYVPGFSLSNNVNINAFGSNHISSHPSVGKNHVGSINVESEEKIPELREATIDEHMRESLKLVSQGPLSDPFYKESLNEKMRRLNIGDNHRKNINPFINSNKSNPLSVNTFPPSCVRYRPHSSNTPSINNLMNPPVNTNTSELSMSIDEGIQDDYGSKSHLDSLNRLSSPQYNDVPTPKSIDFDRNVQDNRQTQTSFITKQSLPDQSNSGIHYVQPTNVKVYPSFSKFENIPPPIPSRDLKPNLPMRSNNRDDVDGLLAPPLPARTQNSNLESIVSQDHVLFRGKSSSLKYGAQNSEAVHQLAQKRSAHSMDMSPWQCQKCTTTNVASDSICSVCSYSRRPTQSNITAQSQTCMPKNTCARCTFENPYNSHQCGACHNNL